MYIEQLRATITSMLGGKVPTDQQVEDIGRAAIVDAINTNRFDTGQLQSLTGVSDPAALTVEQAAQVGNILLQAECLSRLRTYYKNSYIAAAPALAENDANSRMAGLT